MTSQPMTLRLKEAARTINELAKQEEDVRLKLCKAIAAAMDLVKKEGTHSWREWAEANLRKADGSKWSMWTLYSYASFGRDPGKLNHLRESVASNGRNARKALSASRAAVQASVVRIPEAVSKVSRPAMDIPQRRPSGIVLDRQVESLMFAWKNASHEARKIFLEKISSEQESAA